MNRTSEQWIALERWRKAQLESAQSAHAVLVARLERQQTERTLLEQQISDLQEFARTELAQSRALSAAALLRLTQFASQQAQALERSEAALAAIQAETNTAQEVLKTRFQELSVIEKLRERRAQEQRQVAQRREQRWLDEQAAGRCGGAQLN